MSIKGKFKKFFELEDEYHHETVQYEQEPQEELEPTFSHKNEKEKNNVVSLKSVQHQAKVILIEPHTYDEVQDIADQLKNRKCVVINLQRLPHDQAKRIVDFISGTVYAIGGNIQKLGANIFLCTPDNIDVSGSISEMLQE
ncbi:cell division protein SepF [Evansella sp. AB-P1]|uniref:cell division protein SepF n=1 Tax=Evansella sp. AB-P1 TaxID=3037653 RepID=UPI00241D6D4B|nr:cell division protein SepF [Evansella sp. AB-P1]MDG5788272.1 cell division protein SepF [Evansella sp. AB-P1]